MTRYAIDSTVALRLLREGVAVSQEHQLVAPNLLRSQVLAEIYRLHRSGELNRDDARALLDGLATMRIRLLGDRVSRAVAFRIAGELELDEVAPAEFLAVAQLQADALVALDPELVRLADSVVPLADYGALL